MLSEAEFVAKFHLMAEQSLHETQRGTVVGLLEQLDSEAQALPKLQSLLTANCR
ncbi:MAG: hypothetical protein ACI8Y4_003631 [Candidatus Poriferisodalaceae bacterium]|jgi:hypothetical protein